MYHHFYAWSTREGEFVIFRTEQDTNEARVLCYTTTLNNAMYLTDLFNKADA